MVIYLEARTIKTLKINPGRIEYFESYQTKALLSAPNARTKTGRRNQMMLILYYAAAARISELLKFTMDQLHLESEVPYVTNHSMQYRGCSAIRG